MEEELDNVTLTAKKPTEKNRKKSVATVAKLKKIAANKKDKEARLNRRADKIAARRGIFGSGVFNEDGNPDNESLMKARKEGRDVISKRKEARKQYLRNFASQLARAEQAAPTRGFGEGDGNPANDATLSGASAEVAAKKAQQETDARNIFSSFSSIGNDNSDLLSNDIQSLGSFESEDSSPIKYMKQEYRKKRGY